jgi:uncharacterized membrane protein YfcA
VGPSAASLVVVAVAVFAGSALNALSGFGFALVTVPIMATVVGPKGAVVLSALVGLLSNSGVALRHRADTDRPLAGRLLAGSLVGMPLGLLVLDNVAEDPLRVAIALVVLASAAALAVGWRPPEPSRSADVGAGFVSGLFNTSIGISGPPVVLLLQAHRVPKGPFRATTATLFAVAGLVALALFGLGGQYTRTVLLSAAVALPAWPLGWLVGSRVHRRVPEERFRLLVLGLMVLTSGIVLASAVTG